MFTIEVLVLALLIAGGVAARVLFRRPWTVVAEEVATSRPDPEVLTWQVVGWRASGRTVDEVGRHIEAGAPPMPTFS